MIYVRLMAKLYSQCYVNILINVNFRFCVKLNTIVRSFMKNIVLNHRTEYIVFKCKRNQYFNLIID